MVFFISPGLKSGAIEENVMWESDVRQESQEKSSVAPGFNPGSRGIEE
jgi:hypothetical protein